MIDLEKLRKYLRSKENKKKANSFQRYFKTGKGEYGEGDIFLGITVPEERKIAIKFSDLITLEDAEKLLKSKIHEERFVALEILVFKYEKGDLKERKEIYDFYLKNIRFINNWDLVDTSAPYIFGDFILKNPKSIKILYSLAHSKNLWEKRIAIISTYSFIKQNQFNDTLRISEILLNDSHDLIHKAVGWMLREIGNRNERILGGFLKKYYKKMPRTMLRYAIEKFPEEKRKKYLKGEI